ncbi:uncharacterized protein FTOL_05518 [Fusarium torulosum]|uniref:RBR-type E3 ubiquitin transferase n=1 Tax=Fusarium torulosum TaxID=33205 RepID=A0AAE8M7P6_9HYPO|nr:uncharacterized protein FTOL_05518 [Fusarium torulosum]
MATDAFDRIHPDLVSLIIRFGLAPTEEAGFTEANLARICHLAIELADPDEQALIVSRIIPEEELAFERLRSPEVQTISHRVVLDRAERKAALEGDKHEYVPPSGFIQECLICTESAHVRVPCGCDYCLPCFRTAIRRGLRSQEEFPPRCCRPFNEAVIAFARSPPLVHLFRQMREEAETPIHDRLYCHDGHCAAFIPPGCNGACLLCDRKTCVDCFEEAHLGRPCEQGDAEEDVWATMDKNKTVNCPGCGRMIELMEACNHLTCVCGKQFCFICGKVWLSCNCPPYGHLEHMVPMKDRPGVKPPRFRRRRPRRTEESASENAPVRIPQLRPWAGEENRVPRVTVTRSRVIRPLFMPQQNGRQHGRERQHEHERRREHERQQRRRQSAPADGVDPPPLQVRQQRGLHGRRNAVDLLQDERFLAQAEPREANRPDGAPHHHHRQEQGTMVISTVPAPLPGMPLTSGTHQLINPGLHIPVRHGPPRVLRWRTGFPHRDMILHQAGSMFNNLRHQYDNMFNDANVDGEEDLYSDDSQVAHESIQGIQVAQEPQGQPPSQNPAQPQPVQPQGQAAREPQLDPVAATQRLRQLNLAIHHRINNEDVQDAQNQQDGQQTDAGDSGQPREHNPMSVLHPSFFRPRDRE